MKKGRLEAFSDGVIAIIITIMVLEMKVPHGTTLDALKPLLPVFASYVLSFINIGIYWNNHHHMLQATQQVNGSVLWANMHLLFWLSLVPFITGWMGENNFALWPVVIYGAVLACCGVAYYILAHSLVRIHGRDSHFSRALGSDRKGKLSVLIYFAGIGISFLHALAGFILYFGVILIWLIPDRRFENKLANEESAD